MREVGFVDLRIELYRLYGYVDKSTPAEITSTFEQISYAALLESNIEFEIIDVNQQNDHPAIKYLDSLLTAESAETAEQRSKLRISAFSADSAVKMQRRTFPSAVLVSPDGQTLAVPVTKPGQPLLQTGVEQTLRSALDDILISPKRQEILQQVAKAYGVVLLIESADAEQNRKAKEAALAAIRQVAEQMEYLPKPIAHPPVLIELGQELLSQEKVLLWSLGLETENSKLKTQNSEPHAAVFYGRARWVGPMFVGEQITENNLAAVLFIIGADCECGFDHRWLQGTMLPARWDEKLLASAAESLGFDPENPIVKSEISWIVARGSASYPGVPLGYQELVVESEPNRTLLLAPGDLPDQEQLTDASALANVQVKKLKFNPDPAETKFPLGGAVLALVAALTVAIIAVGLFIVFRARKSL